MEHLKRPRTWIVLALVATGLFVTPRMCTLVAYHGRIYDTVEAVPADEPPRIAIVFGAGLAPHREPSPVLYDRVATAADPETV